MFLIKFLIMIVFLANTINSQNQIFITINSIFTHFLFCDDFINSFETSNINIYRIIEDRKININKELSMNETYDGICKKGIYYSSNSEYQKILIEFKKFPTIIFSENQLLILLKS